MVRPDVTRFRCPACRMTETALPVDVLPLLAYDLATLGGLIAAYLDGVVSYRNLTGLVLGLEPPVAATPYLQAVPYSPSASTCFRLLARFAAGARAWWTVAAVALQARIEYLPLPAPDHLAAKARSEAKRATLCDAWQAVDAFRQLANHLDIPLTRWPFVMHYVSVPPPNLDPTGWFIRPPPPPS